MKRASARPSTLFLMELIISILFFSAAAAVCVQFLAKSHTMSQESALLRNAEQCCASIAEIISVSETPGEVLLHTNDYFSSSAEYSDDTFSIYFDSDWNMSEISLSTYSINVKAVTDGDMLLADISAVLSGQNEREIYSLDICRHIQKEVSPDE